MDKAQILGYINLIMPVFRIIIAIFAGVMFGGLAVQKSLNSYKSRKKQSSELALRDTKKKASYDVTSAMLRKTGVTYRWGENFTPFDYTILRFAVSFVVMLIGTFFFEGIGALAGLIIGYILPPLYFKLQGKLDNEDMLEDIQQMYGITALQLRNGVFISKVIYECFLCAKNERLKRALYELSFDIEGMASVKTATIKFREKFDNPYLNLFSMVIEQSQENGKTVEMLNNIEKQIDIINEATEIKAEEDSKARGRLVGFLLFAGGIVIVIYAVVMNIANLNISGLF